jgi:hypothetical protein
MNKITKINLKVIFCPIYMIMPVTIRHKTRMACCLKPARQTII